MCVGGGGGGGALSKGAGRGRATVSDPPHQDTPTPRPSCLLASRMYVSAGWQYGLFGPSHAAVFERRRGPDGSDFCFGGQGRLHDAPAVAAGDEFGPTGHWMLQLRDFDAQRRDFGTPPPFGNNALVNRKRCCFRNVWLEPWNLAVPFSVVG